MRLLVFAVVLLVGCGGTPEKPKTPSMADIAEAIRGTQDKQIEALVSIKASSDSVDLIGPPYNGTCWVRYPARDGYVWVVKKPDFTLVPSTIQFSQTGKRE